MKRLKLAAAAPVILGVIAAGASSEPGTVVPSGRIEFNSAAYDFGKVRAGDIVRHSFVFTNTGKARLEVAAVHLACGCTTAGDWTRRVDPGQTGVIPVQLNTADSWPSGPVAKTIDVDCTDPLHASVRLEMKGTVWKPIDVIPHFAALNTVADTPGSASSTVVRLVNNTGIPLILSAPEVDNPAFAVELKTNQAGQEFALVLAAKPPLTAGTQQGQVRLKTSSPLAPEIRVLVLVNTQPAVAVMPPQIILPAAPLGRRGTPRFTIRNNGTNTLTLCEPGFSLPGVSVRVRETEPGRTFEITLTFPEDFSLPQGPPPSFTVKTTDPHHPLVRVPVYQAPNVPLDTPARTGVPTSGRP